MPIENLNDRTDLADDLMAELAKLPLPPAEKLAVYLKTNFSKFYWRMTDEEWLAEAKEVLEAINNEPGNSVGGRKVSSIRH